MIAIIDYKAGNLQSVVNALDFLGCENKITTDKDEILSSDGVILPGVGAFGDAMKSIRANKLENVVYDCIDKNKPFLGICLGLQMLFEDSEESRGVSGMGIFKGSILKIPSMGLKIPHIGWNSLEMAKESKILKNIGDSPYLYFVHSYYLCAKEKSLVSSTTDYGVKIEASIEKDNLFACQFHPEKSGETGLKILSDFIKLC